MNFAGQVPEWSVSEVPAQKVTGGTPVLPVAGTRPAIFPPLFFAPSLFYYFEPAKISFYLQINQNCTNANEE